MNSKIESMFLCVVMLTSISTPITLDVGEPNSSSSGGGGGLADSPWPMFRGNVRHTSLSPCDTSGNNGKLKWSFTTEGSVESSPAIGEDGTIYVGSMDDKLYAINTDGTEKWNFTADNNVYSSPAIGLDGTIYVGSDDFKLYAINPDGTEKWNFITGWALLSSPAIDSDGTIYFGSDDHIIYAINSDGTKKWSFSTGSRISSSPAIGSDNTIYIGCQDNKLYALNPDGTEKWNFLTGGWVVSSPAIGNDGTIYVGSRDDILYAINPDGTEKWSFLTGWNIDSSPAIGTDGTIYIGSWDGKLYAINSYGTEKWNFKSGDLIDSSPAIGADGTIYIGSDDNKLYAVNPDGTERWNFTTNGRVRSSPAIGSDGTIYVGSGDYKFYAIGTPTPPQTQPPTADAGPDQTVNEGDVVQFNGSGSTAGGGVVPDAVAVWHMDEGSGDTIYDETDYHNDGEIYKATWTTGKYGSALSFDGFRSFVDVPTSPSLNITDMMTIHAWIKPKRTDYGYVVCKELNPGHEGRGGLYSLDIYPGQVRSILHEDSPVNNWHQATGTTNIVYDVWQHIAMTWDGNVLKVFYNGQVEDSVNFTGKIKTSAANVGIGRYGPVFFKGIIDEVAIYDCALSDQDIQRIYQTGSLNYSQPGELTYEWDFNSDVDSDGDGNYTNDVDATGSTPTHIYGDDGIYTVTLTVSTPYETGDVKKIAQDCVLVMDSSGSMGWNDPLNFRIDAAKQYVDKMTPDDRGCVVDFDTDADLMPPGPYDDHLGMDYATIKGNLDYIDSMGGTGISRGLNLSNEELRNHADPSHVPIMILLTDAANNDPIDNNYCLIEANIAASRDIKIFTIGLAMLPNSTEELLLKEIADITDGKYFPAPDAGYLETIYKEISEIVENYSAGRLFDTDTMQVTVRNVAPTLEPITAQGATAIQQGVMEEWVARYNAANYGDYGNALAIGPSGNIYVTGHSYIGDYSDYATVAYDHSGNVLWTSRYNGPASSSDYPYDVEVDASGNVYVTGKSFVKREPFDADDSDFATVSYSPYGNQLWVARYNGPGDGRDDACAIAIGSNRNIYVTGESRGTSTDTDYATIAYDSNGDQLWVARYNGPGNGVDDPRDIAVDNSSGNIIVTGRSIGLNGKYDYATVAYDSDGNELWVARYDIDIVGEPWALVLDPYGNIYVTGGSGGDFVTVAYNSLGIQIWDARIDNGCGYDIAFDDPGRIYVTGRSPNSYLETNYLTVAYDLNGTQLWSAAYAGPGNGYDTAYVIGVDPHGNVIVSGRSQGNGTNADFATIAYSSNGNHLWVERYNGPGNNHDRGSGLAADSSGNIYVTGWSDGDGTSRDMVTIKYSPSTHYECNEGSSIKFTGTASDPGTDDLTFNWNWGDGTSDTVTKYYNNGLSPELDYNPATNEIKSPWGTYPFTTTDTVSHTYGDNGVYTITLTVSDDDEGIFTYTTIITVNNVAPSVDSITAPSGFEGSPIAFSSTVTDLGSDDLTFTWNWGDGTSTTTPTYYNNGASPDPPQSPLGTYPFTVTDIVQHTYGDNGVYTITLTVEDDDDGSTFYETTVNVNNVVPTIEAIIAQNTTLMSQDVTEEWVVRYNPPGYGSDWGRAIAVDLAGNVYVTGYSDSSTTGWDYVTIAYDSLGNELWMARYDGPASGSDVANSIAVDSLGNIYVTGGSRGSGTYSDFATLKYDSSGNLLWVARYNGPASSYDAAHSMAIDSIGNIYIVGESQGSGTSRDFATVAYDSSGNQLWVARYDGPGHDWDEPKRISLDNNGNIYVTGVSPGRGTDDDYATIKYDNLGNEIWVARYNGPGNRQDYGMGLDVDSSGSVYVTGISWFHNGVTTECDYATIKYDQSGNQIWVKRYDGPGNDDFAYDLCVDTSGNVFVTGSSPNGLSGTDFTTIAYDTNGNQLWIARYNYSATSYNSARAMALDPSGYIYITGMSDGVGTDFDYATVAYDLSGNELWVERYNGPGNDQDRVKAIVTDSMGYVYVTGGSMGSGTGYDYATIKYSPASSNDFYESYQITFTANAVDPGSDDLTFSWEFEYGPTIENTYYNNGVSPEPVYDPITNEVKSPLGTYPFNASDMVTHTYGDNYDYTLVLTVTDDDGAMTTYTTTVSVDNLAPSIIELAIPYVAYEGTSAAYRATVKDLGSDDLTFEWDFGDSTPVIENTFYNNGTTPDPYPSPDGIFPFIAQDTIGHTYGDNYNYTLTFKVTDDDKGVSTLTTTVYVDNVAPTIEPFGPFTVDEGMPFDLSAISTDLGSDDLTFTWEFEYGPTITNVHYNDGVNPDPYPSPEGNYPFNVTDIVTHTYGDNGVFTVTLTVIDDDNGKTSYTTNITVNNVAPTITAIWPTTIMEEGTPFTLSANSTDQGSDDLTFSWKFELVPATTNILYNDGSGPDPYPSPWGTYPFSATDQVTHAYGDNGVYTVTLTVEDDDKGVASFISNFTIYNVAPQIQPFGPFTVDEASPLDITATSTDPGSDDLTFTWEFEYGPTYVNSYYNDGTGPDPYPSPWGTYPFSAADDVGHTYGDNGVFGLTLTVEDDDGDSTTFITNITVENVAPVIEKIEAYVYVNISLRVAGEKYHSVDIYLYEEDFQIWTGKVTRYPGSPDDQKDTINNIRLDMTKRYSAIVDYLPNDPRVNGNVWGGNPVWIEIEFENESTARIHHTFNVRQSYWNSDHWNHIDPWEVELNPHLLGHNITLEGIATDPGSDDLTFTWDFGDGATAGPTTYFNNGVSPDPYPSPDINPMWATDTCVHSYTTTGTYTITLVIEDDDGAITITTLEIGL